LKVFVFVAAGQLDIGHISSLAITFYLEQQTCLSS